MISITQIDRFPPVGPELFFMTFFDIISTSTESILRGSLWTYKDGKILLYDATDQNNQNYGFSLIRFAHVDTAEARFFRLQTVSVVPVHSFVIIIYLLFLGIQKFMCIESV